jgi:hypothetical protein
MTSIGRPLLVQDNCQSCAVALFEEKPNDRIKSFGRLLFSYGHHAQVVGVQNFGIDVTKRREHDAAHAARTAFQISGALLSLMRSPPGLN